MTRPRQILTIALLGIVATAFSVAACGGGSATPSAPASGPVGSGPVTSLTIVAKDIAYTPASMSAPAGSPLKVRFENGDPGVPHDLALFGDAGFSTKLYESAIKTGPSVEELSIPGLIAGTYQFRCQVHPNMTAELKVGA